MSVALKMAYSFPADTIRFNAAVKTITHNSEGVEIVGKDLFTKRKK